MTRSDLMQDGLSEYDLANMTEIIREGWGDWYHARLLHSRTPQTAEATAYPAQESAAASNHEGV